MSVHFCIPYFGAVRLTMQCLLPFPPLNPLWPCPCRPPYSSCRTPQTKRELLGVRYAVQGVDGLESVDELAPPGQPQVVSQHELGPHTEHPKACSDESTASQTGLRYTLLWSPRPPPAPPPPAPPRIMPLSHCPCPLVHNQDDPFSTSYSTAPCAVVTSASRPAGNLQEVFPMEWYEAPDYAVVCPRHPQPFIIW